MKYTGLFLELIDNNGKKTYVFGKTFKGLLRDHRKGKCKGLCNFCYEEATEGARFEHVKYHALHLNNRG